MASSKQKRLRRERLEELKKDPEFLENILEAMSSGVALQILAQKYDVNYPTLRRWLTSDDERAERYRRAQDAKADYYVQQFEANVERTRDDENYDPKRAKVVGDGWQWLAKVHNPRAYSDKQQVEHTHQGSVGLHLQAVQSMRQQHDAGELQRGQTLDGELEDGDDSDELKGEGLL